MAKLKQSTSFDIGLLEYASKTKMLKPIALFYLIKAKFHHSIIYNYNPYKLSKTIGLHHKTVDRYVKKLIKEDFCELRDGHLLFRATKKILPAKESRKSRRNLQTRPYTSFQGILNRIYTVILLNNKEQQKFRIATHYGKHIGQLNPRTQKKAKKLANLEDRGLANSQKAITSISGASRLFNLSKVTSHRILTRLRTLNYLKMNSVIECLGKVNPPDFKYYYGLGHLYFKRGYLYLYLGREIQEGTYLDI